MSAKDIRSLHSLKTHHPMVRMHINWKEEIEAMERNQVKVELEALNHFGYDFLPRWIAQCIQHHDWLQ